jgi:molecular chaperone GrpE
MADEKDTRSPGDAARAADAAEPEQESVTAAGGGDAGVVQEDASVDSPEVLTERLGEALQKADAYRDQARRAQAEAENTRRRASRDVENAHKYALEKFSADLLPVLDSLEKAVEVAAATEAAESIAEGVQLSLKLFLSVLEKQGIERIDPHGEPFDPQRHEALAMVPSHHAEPNSVIDVMQRGYLLNGRLVRAAKVIVSKAPAAEAE